MCYVGFGWAVKVWCFEQGKNSTHVPSRERKMVKKSGAERTVIVKSC